MKAALNEHGWTEQSRVTILADGADGLMSLVQEAISQTPSNVLDWFHISMRLRSIEQMGPSVADVLGDFDPSAAAAIRIKIPRLRYQMWQIQFLLGHDKLDTTARYVNGEQMFGVEALSKANQ